MGRNNQRKALFLDRDGTINIEKNYLHKIEDFEFQPGIIELLHEYQNNHFLLFVITNQSGIARGYYSESDFLKLNEFMLSSLQQEGIKITKVYYCPHHPKFSGDCNCRKPKPGMILDALNQFNINPVTSVLIGDKKRDILAGENAGIGKNIYIQDILKDGIF